MRSTGEKKKYIFVIVHIDIDHQFQMLHREHNEPCNEEETNGLLIKSLVKDI